MKRLSLIVVCLILVILPLTTTHAGSGKGISDERFARLARGINLPGWFWYGPETVNEIRNRFAPEEFVQLRDIGMTYVRIPINLPFVHDESQSDLLNDEHVKLLEDGIRMIQAAGLATIVDIHSTSLEDSDASDYSAKLENPDFAERFIAFWSSFSKRLSSFDPELTFFGPMNEPVFQDDPPAWFPLQERLIAAIRASAPEHTIIATGSLWSGIEQLMALEPLSDPNIVYDFHFYAPMPFTHQGATWTQSPLIYLRSVPYPSSPEAVAPLLDKLTDKDAREILKTYGDERWDAERLQSIIGDVVWWSGQVNVRLICAEFGVLRDYADPESRARWLHDVVSYLEQNGVGWSMWDYDGNFGMATRQSDGTVKLDPIIVAALGLKLPEQAQ
ncbi:MAG: cellulase family glycosylhydrolase [Anaerolineae bacterium]|nr:cellulase family glycosylhydrolase [Anaerolineae bacterium]